MRARLMLVLVITKENRYGRIAKMSTCMQGATLGVRNIERAK